MRPHWRSNVVLAVLMLVILIMTVAGGDAAYADDQRQCFLESIQATFKAGTSTYRVEAGCREYSPGGIFQESVKVSMHWSSQGTYDPRTGIAREDISVKGSTIPATVTTTLSCPSDPWLGPSLEPGMVRCTNPTFQTSAGDGYAHAWFQYLQEGFYSTEPYKKIGPLPNSTGFQYNRADLIAQRDAEAKAEAAAALQQQNKRLNQAVQPGPARVAPTILSPAASALFLSNTSVPIKIAPPQSLAVTGYFVKIESRNAQGLWTPMANLPVSAAEASSPAGYMGWGAPGPGRGQAMIAGPGTYRVSAQVFSPQQTLWSQPVEFVVTAPSKAIQKAPKMFGQ